MRRSFAILSFATVTSIFTVFYLSRIHHNAVHDISQHLGLGDWTWRAANVTSNVAPISAAFTPLVFEAGTPKPHGSNYTKTVVMARMRVDDVSWTDEHLDPSISKAIYVANDPFAPLHPPKNKGHEVMTYLTYIIDHYDNLPEIAIFLHAHRNSWHNADILDGDAAEMVRRLNPAHVTRQGYVNLRCSWAPGCPDWMHPGATDFDKYKSEEILLAKAWAEIFPMDSVPTVLAQPCCGQFALSRQRMLALPRSRYIFYRDWLLKTRLRDNISGRIWEYIWQYVFTGQSIFCPAQHSCYCDAFGVCFGGPEAYNNWWVMKQDRDALNSEWLDWEEEARQIKTPNKEDKQAADVGLADHDPFKANVYAAKINDLQARMDKSLAEANKRGEDPKARAEEVGRPWKEGDGF